MAIKIYPWLVFTLLFAGCTLVHEFPGEPAVDPYLVSVTINLDLDMQMEGETIQRTNAATRKAYATTPTDDYDLRYIVDIYEDNGNVAPKNRVQRILKTEAGATASGGVYRMQETVLLPISKYLLVVWVDFVDKGTVADKYYDTDDLQQISILPQSAKYVGYNTSKDAFTGKNIMDLTPYHHQRFVQHNATIDLKRPFAVYRIVTTDLRRYVVARQSSIKPAATNLAYNLFFPMGYNAYLQKPDNFTANVGYGFDVTETTPDEEALLASDLVFVDDNDTFYHVDFEVTDANRQHINTRQNLKINLRRNHLTIIYAEFLTENMNGGSIGIDDGFDDEIIIEL
jgi:hypothetical protein